MVTGIIWLFRMMPKFLPAHFFIFLPYIISFNTAFELSSSRLLLPFNGGLPVNISLDVIDAFDACFKWHSSAPHLTKIYPHYDENLCSKKAIISSVSDLPEQQEAVISVHEKGSNRTLFCEVLIDSITRIHLLHSASQLSLGSPPLAVSIIAMNAKGHTFSTLNNVKIEWKIETLSSYVQEKEDFDVVRFFNCLGTSYKTSCIVSSKEIGMTSTTLIVGENLGSANVIAKLENSLLGHQDNVSASFIMNVTLDAKLRPSNNVYLYPGAFVGFHFETKYGKTLDLSNFQVTVQNTSVVENLGNLKFKSLQYGKSRLIFEYSNKSFTADITVVKPSSMKLTANTEENWKLHEATTYEVFLHLFDIDGNEISLLDSLKASIFFPTKFFHINSSSSNGVRHNVRALIPGSGVIKAHASGVEIKGKIEEKFEIRASQKFTIYQSVQVQPPVLLLPFYSNISALYAIPFKATGGTGVYKWISYNSGVEVLYDDENSSQATVYVYKDGDFTISVIDANHSKFRSLAKVYIHQVAEIEVYATVVEAEVGNDLIVPVALYGYESEERKRMRSFDDCSKINVSVDVIEKHIVSYKPDANIPPYGRGCLTFQFTCKLPGHSRINIASQLKHQELRTTVVVACHKPLKAIHPVRVGVLPLGAFKDIVFEGGPRPWPLHPSSYYENLTSDHPVLLDISVVKDPVRYNKDLHVFRVLCRDYGETMLRLHLGNHPSATNHNPAQLESSIKIVCSRPHSLHIALKQKKIKNTVDKRNVVKVPFYGSKIFEVDVWVKDDVGRKFANISSLDIIWMVSDNNIAKPVNHRDFITHIDGSKGYQKVSRNFQEIEMIGKTGDLIVTAKLNGYRKDILTNEISSNKKHLQNLSSSLELHLISMRDAYADAYGKPDEQENAEHCDEENCKS